MTRPLLNGLVLAGGKSKRMGSDKGKLQWHGKEHRYYLADLLSKVCDAVFISCREEQEEEITSYGYQTIKDAFTGLGPYGAIVSAFQKQPHVAWLVIACDLPLLDVNTIQYLIQHRNSAAIATTFQSPYDGLPEPLVTIWEPQSYAVLLSYLEEGRSCPRKVLLNTDVCIIKAPHPNALTNANTPEEAKKVKELVCTQSLENGKKVATI